MEYEPFAIDDTVYNKNNEGNIGTDENIVCLTLIYHVKKVLEYKFSPSEQQTFDDYKTLLEAEI